MLANPLSFQTWACRAFYSVFGKHVTTNGARHAFLSAIDTSRVWTSALEALAKEMGHSVAQQRAYVRLSQAPEDIRTEAGELRLPCCTPRYEPVALSGCAGGRQEAAVTRG